MLKHMRRELLACGLAGDGQLGIRKTDSDCVTVPEHIIGGPNGEHGSTVVAIACGEKHTLFLADNGQVWSVGCNEHGQLGRGSQNSGSFTIYPVSITKGIKAVQVAAGRYHSLAVFEDGRLFSWGSNEHGQLGIGSVPAIAASPKKITLINEVVQIAAGQDNCIALTENGRVWIWGEQANGYIHHVPVEVDVLQAVPIVRICAGGGHYMALTSSGSVFAWGANDYGQLGLGDLLPRDKPRQIESIMNMKICEMAAGYSHSLLLTTDGKVFAFGSNSLGQLGSEHRVERQSTPIGVSELMGSTVTRVACGRCHSAVVIAGRFYPFGLNTSGQLGTGTTRNQLTPRRNDALSDVRSIFAGWDQMFIIRIGGVPELRPGSNAILKEPRFLTKESIMNLLQKGEKLDLIGELESVFSSFSSINGSFLYSDERRYLSSNGFRTSGVDLDAVMEAFNAIAESNDAESYITLLEQWASEAVSYENGARNPFHSAESLRIFLILPWLNFFTTNVTPAIVKTITIPFAERILALDHAQDEILEKWWTYLPGRHFNRIVSVMISGIKTLIKHKKEADESEPLLLVLKKLNGINRKTNAIPFECFYIDELGELFDLKEDYCNWVQHEKFNIPMKRCFWVEFPFLLNGIAKSDLLHVESALQQQEIVNQSTRIFFGPLPLFSLQPFLNITVRRDNIVNDTMAWMSQSCHRDFLRPLKIQFVGEEGEDAGGVKKEFFILLFQQILQADYGMFVEDSDSHFVWFSGFDVLENINYELLGILFGMAIYNHVLVPFPFPLALYKLLLDQSPTIEDLLELSPVEGRSLQQLLDYDADDFEDVFNLTFEITVNNFGAAVACPLKPKGEDISVTQSNKQEYVKLYIRHRLELGLNDKIAQQLEAFRDGFRRLIRTRLLFFFQPRELMEMVVGNENYDWSEFRQCVEYKGEYNKSHPAILAFWECFFKLTLDERKMFMKFLMGSTRLPVRGLQGIRIYIQPCADHLLPVAHTCANLLELPNITDVDEMYRRLLVSIQHTEGFTLV